MGLGFVPYVSSGISAVQAVTGKNLFNGDQVDRREQVLDFLLGLVPGGKAGKQVFRSAVAVKSEGQIYRAASGTPASMTPGAKDTKELSANDSLANALPGKNQVIDTSKLKSLCAVCDSPGHVSILPKDASQMQSWINSRGGSEVHPLTWELMDAVVRTVKK